MNNGLLLYIVMSFMTAAACAADSSSILIKNVHVFDGQNEALIENAKVLIKGTKISKISIDSIDASDAKVIDGKGGTLMPGMIDNHFHVTYAELPLDIFSSGDMSEVAVRGVLTGEATLMRGFTTVRDLGGNPFTIKKMIESGELKGPRIYPSGFPISQTSGHFDFRDRNAVPVSPGDPLNYWERNALLMTADGVPEVTRRVREALRMGATQIKLAAGGGTSSSFDPLDVQQYTLEEMQAAVKVAETWGTYVTVHAYTPTAIQTAIKAGVRVIEHGQLLDDKTMKLLKQHDIWLSLQPFIVEDESQYSPLPVVRAKQEKMVQGTATAYQLAQKYGVNIAFGTDILFGNGDSSIQSHYITLLEKFGYTPYQALKMVTHDNAQLVKLSGNRDPYPGDLGVIAEDAWADLIIVKGNPLDDLSLVEDPDANFALIMKNGEIIKNTLD